MAAMAWNGMECKLRTSRHGLVLWHGVQAEAACFSSPEMTWHGMQTEEASLHRPLPMQPHRDSEKVDGMFATLSIILPSTYDVRGGQ